MDNNKTNDFVTAYNDDEDDDEDSVDWQDGDDQDEYQDDANDSQFKKLEPITIHLKKDNNNKEEEEEDASKANKKKRRRTHRRNVYRHASLSSSLQSVLTNLHQAHILGLISHAVSSSSLQGNTETTETSETTETTENSDIAKDALVLHLAHSLIPPRLHDPHPPTLSQLQRWMEWYWNYVDSVHQRRNRTIQANQAAGAPRIYLSNHIRRNHRPSLIQLCHYLSCTHDENPQLLPYQLCLPTHDRVRLLLAMTRSLGWRVRYVTALEPMSLDLTVNHPLLGEQDGIHTRNGLETLLHKQHKKTKLHGETSTYPPLYQDLQQVLAWVEILCQSSPQTIEWIPVSVHPQWIHQPRLVEAQLYARRSNATTIRPQRRQTLLYALAVEHSGSANQHSPILTDVTRRYANSWSKSLQARGPCQEWFQHTLDILNGGGGSDNDNAATTGIDAIDDDHVKMNDDKIHEEVQLRQAAAQEAMPTTKTGFQNHKVYLLHSQLNTHQVLRPTAKPCGMYQGQAIYHRQDVFTSRTAHQWLRRGRKVRPEEIPIQRLAPRKKRTPTSFQPLPTYHVGVTNDGSQTSRQAQLQAASVPESDGLEDLYAEWQTEPWSPDPVGPNDDIPVNDYNNVELALINPGLVHLEQKGMAQVAKKLGLPYAPCLTGFEGQGGNRAPCIRGIVVHEHNVQLLQEAFSEFEQHTLEQQEEERQRRVLKRWKKLIHGILLKERLEKEYGDKKDG